MNRHHTSSPENRFNAYLDALASGQSTPDASDAFVDTNADPSVPAETARELHDLARGRRAAGRPAEYDLGDHHARDHLDNSAAVARCLAEQLVDLFLNGLAPR